MTTAVEVANIGLKRVLVQAADAPLAADEYADFYAAMNNFMATLSARGVKLGYTNVSAAADVVTVPDGAIEAIAANVAVRVASDYGSPISPSLAAEAREGRATLSLLGVNIGQTSIDSELPYGSGSNVFISTPMTYGTMTSAKLTLSGNADVTTITASATPVKVRGFWHVSDFEGMEADITGRVTAQYKRTYIIKLEVTAFASGSVSAATIAIVKNGDVTNIPASQYISPALSTTQSSHTLRVSLTLQPGDYVELWVADIFGTENITVTDAVMEVN